MNKVEKVISQLSAAEAQFMVDKLCSLSPDQQDMVNLDKKEFDETQTITQDSIEGEDHARD